MVEQSTFGASASPFDREDARVRARRMIAGALAPLLGPVRLRRSIDLFEREVGDVSQWNFSIFADRLCSVLGLEEQRGDLERRLQEANRLDSTYLPPDPLAGQAPSNQPEGLGEPEFRSAAGSSTRSAPRQQVEASPEATVLSMLVTEFLKSARLAGATDFLVPDLRSKPSAWGVAEVNRELVSDALASGTLQPAAAMMLSKEDGRALLQRIYDLLCDEFGPVLVDRWLGRAIRQAEALPEASRASPRAFL